MTPPWNAGFRFGPLPATDARGLPAVPGWGRAWVSGQCFHFALALLDRLPDGELVGVGDPDFPDHVAVRHGGMVLDVRGEMDEAGFCAAHPGLRVVQVSLATAELHAGLAGTEPPYEDVEEMDEAREAVERRFPALLAPAALPSQGCRR